MPESGSARGEGALPNHARVVMLMVPGSRVAESTNSPFSHVPAGWILTVTPELRIRIYVWLGQGYLDLTRRFHLWPPLLALDPTPSSPGDLFHGIGGSVAVDLRTGDIWGADYDGRRLNRLRPQR